MRYYLAIGLALYIVMCVVNYGSFRNATVWQVVKGAIWGVGFWPFAMALYLYDLKER